MEIIQDIKWIMWKKWYVLSEVFKIYAGAWVVEILINELHCSLMNAKKDDY